MNRRRFLNTFFSLLINDAGRRLLIDPVFSDIFWFIRDYTPFAFELNEMPAPDQVLLTHGHYDHLDTAALSQLPRGVHVISPLGYAGILDELGDEPVHLPPQHIREEMRQEGLLDRLVDWKHGDTVFL